MPIITFHCLNLKFANRQSLKWTNILHLWNISVQIAPRKLKYMEKNNVLLFLSREMGVTPRETSVPRLSSFRCTTRGAAVSFLFGLLFENRMDVCPQNTGLFWGHLDHDHSENHGFLTPFPFITVIKFYSEKLTAMSLV